jgi:AraC-like DNA-binding protein
MVAWMQKNVLEKNFPFKLFFDNGVCGCNPHWHDEVEIIYIVEGTVKAGVNNCIYILNSGDVLLIGGGDIHYFLPVNGSNRVVIQFNMSIFQNLTSADEEKRAIRPVFDNTNRISSRWPPDAKYDIKRQVKGLIGEYTKMQDGYKLALKARLYDLVVVLLRKVPIDKNFNGQETRQKENLRRLENTFTYVEENYQSEIKLEDAAFAAGFSLYHFARFFKQNTGMTFVQYLNNFKVTKAEWLLMNEQAAITDIAFKAGFNSVKTFNRIFKQIKGHTPTEYKKQNMRIT